MSDENISKTKPENAIEMDDKDASAVDEKTPLKSEEVEVAKAEDIEKVKEDDRDPEQPPETDPEPEVKQPRRKFDFFENKWILLGILLLLLLAIIIVIIAIVATRRPPAIVTVTVSNLTKVSASGFCGVINGEKEGDVYVFRGIPYAEPPVGNRRWSDPVGFTYDNCWKTPFNATTMAPSCYQQNGSEPQSEDCLYLDVFTPNIGFKAKLPVLVYIPADDISFLRGTDAVFQPTPQLAEEMGRVFVRFNYRVGPFGYFLKNYGLMDQIEALKWVYANIDAFGGDRQKVTIFGVGSGAASVLALLSAPKARGYFHKAWISSGVEVIQGNTGGSAYNSFVAKTSCQSNWNDMSHADQKQCLRDLTSEEVANADYMLTDDDIFYTLPSTLASSTANRPVRLNVNTQGVLPISSNDALKSPETPRVPLLIGSMGQEVQFYHMNMNPDMSWDEFYTSVTDKLHPLIPATAKDSLRQQIEDLYPQFVSPKYQMASLVSDMLVQCPLDRLANLTSSNGFPTYRYDVVPTLYSDPDAAYVSGARWAFHGYDMAAFFGQLPSTFKMASKYGYDLSTEEVLNFDKNLQSFMRSIVKHLTSCGKVPEWVEFRNGSQTYDLSSEQTSLTQSRYERCKLLSSMTIRGDKIRSWEF